MNIFVLDENPRVAAKYMCNKHVVKMILESCQLLSTAVIENGGVSKYKVTHKNHPCAVWCRQTRSNFDWLIDHCDALFQEYFERYGKTHASLPVFEQCVSQRDLIPDGELTTFPLCMPDEFKVDDVVESYRNYYRGAKRDFAVWFDDPPYWFK